ncbi:GNAT superfamily N-acetyltransferase [Bradyrhizobium japonicum]|uniref:GNAT family N-acetyltransferase n=1 Tax=Bradyrhizobium TaxID=374 RepID=UPI0003647D40|nr:MULTISPECIES: GNAT family N-acetyltransferase [Bradyrhizobium]MBP2429168.1 GNAT superfamily N-acetyltransferase [Bradyrhizobium elkanii]MCP1737361.1 GNAT superfamily N-acetyltransferase [Bradyrhizobium elkanii]MCS3572701.1 GNAT superfamily N-acetyltransferase [Bradyrhizobium elkanii]MCS3585815.1 GNAT superfamily N-acetyltransferase [Bradyrhizobium elkanii]MCS3624049.1 GNAT superfamily N-acetyltransferase [Bradyrhizobium elkanii]
MTVDVSKIYLLDVASGGSVEAELRDAIEQVQLNDWQTKWRPALLSILQELARKGVPMDQWPQSWHWDWNKKTARVQGLLAFRGFSVVALGETQGLAQIDLTKMGREANQRGKPLVYLDYLEVAPWNRPDLGNAPRLRGVGTALITAAVALSEDEGFKGRLGLHSLPQADNFYRKIGMTDLGQDAAYQNLRYFEMTSEQARAFFEKEENDET